MSRINGHIEIVNGLFSTTSTSFGPTTHDCGLIEWDDTKWDNVIAVYFEAVLSIDFYGAPNGLGTVTAELYNKTNSSDVTASQISTSGAPSIGPTLEIISENIKASMPTGGAKDLSVRIKVSGATQTGHLRQARIVVVQETPFTKTRIYLPVGPGTNTSSTSYVELMSKRILLDIGRWAPITTARFHAAVKSGIGTTSDVELYNLTNAAQLCTVAVGGGTSFNLYKTTFTFPSSDIECVARLKNRTGGGSLCNTANAHLILDIENSPHLFELHYMLSVYEKGDSDPNPVNPTGALHVWRKQHSELDMDIYYEAVLKTNNATYYARAQLRDDGVIVVTIESNSLVYDRKVSVALAEFDDLSILKAYEYISGGGVIDYMSSSRIIVVVKNFLISSSYSLPVQVRKKIGPLQSLPVQARKKLAITHSLPAMLQLTVPPSVVFAQSTETLRPNAPGTNTGNAPVGAAANWDCVDEDPSDEDTTYVRGAWGSLDLYSVADSALTPATVIDKIEVVGRVRTPRAGLRAQIVIRDPALGGAQFGAFKNLTASFLYYTDIYTVNPYTSAPWTVAQVNALNIGISFPDGESVAANQPRCTQMSLVIYYQSGSPAVEPQFSIPVQLRKKISAQFSLPIQLRKKDVSSQYAIPVMLRRKVERAFSLPVELRKKIAATYSLPVQISSPTLERTFSLPVQTRRKVSSQHSAPIQLKAKISRQFSLPAQIIKKLSSSTFSLPVEIRKRISVTHSIPIQIQSLTFAAAFSLPVQLRKKLAKTFSLPAEIIKKASRTASLPIQIGPKISSQKSMPVQIRKKTQIAYSLPIEILKTVECPASIPVQVRKRLGAIRQLPIEIRKELSPSFSLPVMIGTLVFSLNIIEPQLLLTLVTGRIISITMNSGRIENMVIQVGRLENVKVAS